MYKNLRLPFSACNLFTPHLFLNRLTSPLCKLLQTGLPLLIFSTSFFLSPMRNHIRVGQLKSLFHFPKAALLTYLAGNMRSPCQSH